MLCNTTSYAYVFISNLYHIRWFSHHNDIMHFGITYNIYIYILHQRMTKSKEQLRNWEQWKYQTMSLLVIE